MRSLFLLPFLILPLTACVNPQKRFDRIQVGMEKDQVLEIMESPQETRRWKDTDRWTYIYYDHDQRVQKEVQFADGIAIYKGDPQKPAISAEEQDKINAEANAALDQQIAAKRQENQNNYNKYEEETRGTGEIRYVPQFTPVQ